MPIPFNVTNDPHQTIGQINQRYISAAIEEQKNFPDRPAIELSFGSRAKNSSLVVARAFVDYMNSIGVRFSAKREGDAFGYANRIGFFSDFNNAGYEYQKHAANGRFLEIEKIEPHDMGVAAKVKSALDDYSLLPGVIISEEAHDILLYSIGELISNVRRHARFSGRVSFQYYPSMSSNEITVCDCGIGIIESLKQAYPGNDLELLKMSIQNGVTSSISHGPYGERSPGVGLYNLCKLAQHNPNLAVTIHTKNFRMVINQHYPVESPLVNELLSTFQGTMVKVSIPNLVNVNLSTVLNQYPGERNPFIS